MNDDWLAAHITAIAWIAIILSIAYSFGSYNHW